MHYRCHDSGCKKVEKIFPYSYEVDYNKIRKNSIFEDIYNLPKNNKPASNNLNVNINGKQLKDYNYIDSYNKGFIDYHLLLISQHYPKMCHKP
jgi:hypothetical protein